MIQKCWHQSPNERPTCSIILQTLGNLSFPDNWKALLGTCNVTVGPEICNRARLTNDIKLNVIAEDNNVHTVGGEDEGICELRRMKDDLKLDEFDERPRAPIFSRSLSAPIPTPPPPPPMPRPCSMLIAPNIITLDQGKGPSCIDTSNGYGFGITTDEIQRQRKLLKSRVRCQILIIFIRNVN